MAEGHAGPHKVGGPYHTVEEFVTKCPDGHCNYHHNSNRLRRTEWLECIHCGHKVSSMTNEQKAKWDAIIAANPVLRDPSFRDKVKKWNALKEAADKAGMTDEEAVAFIAHEMQAK